MKRGTFLAAFLCLALLAGASSASASNLNYYGGPVVHSAKGVVVEWGSGVNSVFTDTTTGVPGMLSYWAQQSGSTSDLGAVLAQYMDSGSQNSTNAVSYGGDYRITPSHTSSTLQDTDVQAELASQISAGHLPAPTGPSGLGTIYLVIFPKTISVCMGSTCDGQAGGFCAYHGNTNIGATNVLYAVLPSDEPGTGNNVGCGDDPSYLNNFTAYTAHEWGETVNDPLVAASTVWGPPLGWYDPTFDGEIADKCDSQPLTTNGAFTVEPLWSNADGTCQSDESTRYSPPTASFTPPSGALPNQAAGFDASASSDPAANHTSAVSTYNGSSYSISAGIAHYDWNWGDGTPDGSGATPSHTYADPGNYTVTLTVTDNMGFSGVSSQAVVIGTPAAGVTTQAADGVSESGATLHGTVNTFGQSATYRFVYGTAPTAMSSATPTTAAPTSDADTPVSATLSGLAPSTTYYYRLEVQAGGQTVPGQIQHFTTGAAPPPPQTPTPGTGGATSVTTNGAVLNGTVNPGGSSPVSYRFAYGTSSSSLNLLTPLLSGPAGTNSVPVSTVLGGLSPHTTYYFRLDVVLNGTWYAGGVQSFTTRAPAPGSATGGAQVHGTNASLTGSVNPHGVATKYYFKFGTSSSYGQTSAVLAAGSGTAPVPASIAVSGLRPNTRYHYRLVAFSVGGIAVGADTTFKTGAKLAHPPRMALDVVRGQRLVRALQNGLQLTFSCSRACRVSVGAIPRLAGLSRSGAALPVSVAHGTGAVAGPGKGQLTLHFSPAARRRLRARRSVELIVTGFASARGSATGVPVTVNVVLR